MFNNFEIFIFFILCFQNGGSDSLRWSRSGMPVIYREVNLKTATFDFNVDIFEASQIVIIRDIQQWNYTMTIHCFITGYNKGVAAVFSFCKYNGQCVLIKAKDNPNFLNEFNLYLKIESIFADQRGVRINVQVPNKYEDTSGLYFCKVDEDNISIRSNYIEIRDIFFWERQMFTKVESSYKSSIKVISMPTVPIILNCSDGNSMRNPRMPAWARLEFYSPVSWSVCPVRNNYNQQQSIDKMSPEKCLSYTNSKCDGKINPIICPRPLAKMSAWKYYVNDRGDLIFTDLPYENTNTGETYLLMCYTKNTEDDLQAITYFLDKKNDVDIEVGVAFDGSQRTFSQKLESLSPMVQDVVIYSRSGTSGQTLDTVAIYCLYRSSSDASFQWKHNSVNINSNTLMTVTKYMVLFDNKISAHQAGKYTLEITDKTSRLVMEVNVRVQGLPVLANDSCILPLVYVWEYRDLIITCNYQLRPTTLKVMINSQEILLNDSLSTSQAQLKSMYPHLADLSFSVSPTEYQEMDSVTMTYTAYNLSKSKPDNRYQDHSVTFQVSNIYGQSLRSSSIYVLPRLSSVISQFPDQYNCTTACTSSASHKFKCDLNLEHYGNKELTVDHYWSLSGQRLGVTTSMFAKYFEVDPITKELTLLPILSSNPFDIFVKSVLNDTFFECHVTLNSTLDSKFLYSSSADNDLMDRMKARIILGDAGISQASHQWIVGVVFGILALIIMSCVIVYYCRNIKGKKGSAKDTKYSRAQLAEAKV